MREVFVVYQQYYAEWFNPPSGGALTTGSISTVRGPGPVDLGNPPIDPTQDWVILIRAQSQSPPQPLISQLCAISHLPSHVSYLTPHPRCTSIHRPLLS